MNLKDAFRFQNKLQGLMQEADMILSDRRNILKVKTTHLRSKVMADAEDVEVEDTAPSEYAGYANEVAAFLWAMLAEREKLSMAIHDAKSKMMIDMDSEVGLNKARQSFAETLRRMTSYRTSEKTITGGGSGFRFNAEGNQVTYKCDAKVVTSIDFDRDKIRGMAEALGRKADETSSALDRCLVNTEVDYVLPFDMNANFDEILSDFIARQATSDRK